jgi:hypothetical protein
MIKITLKKVFALYSVLAIFLLLYFLSFNVFSGNKEHKKHFQDIQLLHEADISTIDQILIQNNTTAILLERQNNMWLACKDFNFDNLIPADTQQLQKLFVNLCSKHKMAKAGNKNNVQAYGLTQEDVTVISLYKDGQEYEHLFFGDTDFSQTGRYFTTNELNSVFLFDSSFDNYISINTQVWCDPYIISSQLKNSVFNMGDIQNLSTDSAQKLLELRHGGFAEQSEIEAVLNNTTKQLEDIHLQMGDKSTIVLSIYNSILTDNEYIVKTTFISDRTGQSLSYFTKISLWTYNKISEITL